MTDEQEAETEYQRVLEIHRLYLKSVGVSFYRALSDREVMRLSRMIKSGAMRYVRSEII